LTKDRQGRYALTPESAMFLVSTKPSFQGGLILHCSEQLIPNWLSLNEIVATGKPSLAVNRKESGAAFFQTFVEDIFPMSYPSAQVLAGALDLAGAGPPV